MTRPAVLDGPPEQPPLATGRRCAECPAHFAPRDAKQLFCGIPCKRAYNNRWLTRGAVLAPIYTAARVTRGGSRGDKAIGRKARQAAEQLVQRWIEEDAAAGRLDAVAYVAHRLRHGLLEVLR